MVWRLNRTLGSLFFTIFRCTYYNNPAHDHGHDYAGGERAAAVLPNVNFREIADEKGDSATFLAFMLEDCREKQRVAKILTENGCPAIDYGENSWHYYPKWEHLLEGKTITSSGYPFTCGMEEGGETKDKKGGMRRRGIRLKGRR